MAVTAPAGLTASVVSGNRVDLAWDAVTDADEYDVERDGVVIATGLTVRTYSDTAVAPGRRYAYRVRAVDYVSAPVFATVIWKTSGAVTATSAVVACKTPGATAVRVRLYNNAALTGTPQVSAPVAAGTYGESKHTFTGLTAGSQYHYMVQADGVDDATVGRFTTTGASTCRWAASGCALTGSTDPVFRAIAAEGLDTFMHLGDAQYGDESGTDPARWAQLYDSWLGSATQQELWRSCQLDMQGSDHDTGPNNNDTGTVRGITRWAEFYRRYMPHHPLASTDGQGVYRTYLLMPGVRVIATDTRTYKSPRSNTDDAAKTMLGSVQKQWFKDTLLAATEPLIIWQQELPWNTAGPEAGSDSWRGYHTERQELAAFVTANDLSKRLFMVFSDIHACGWIARADSNYGGFPIAVCGPLDQANTSTQTAMTIGPIPGVAEGVNRHQYGLFQLTRTATDITLEFTGKRVETAAGQSTTSVIIPTQTVTYPLDYSTPPPAPPAAFPADLAGLIARLRGEELGEVGSAIASWASPDGTLTATQPTTTLQPVVVAGPNGTKGAQFTSDSLILPASFRAATAGTQGYTAFVVATPSTVATGNKDLLFVSNGVAVGSSRLVLQLNNSTNSMALAYRRADADAVVTVASTSQPVAGQPYVHAATLDFAAGSITLERNGAAVATAAATVGTVSATAAVGAAIGSKADGATEFWPGAIFQVIIFGRPLSPAERSRVYAYIRDAYQLPVTVL